MDAVLRGAAIYVVLLLLFRLVGRRALSQVTMFDLVILLIISEATQQALLGEDFSITQATLVITTLLLLERFSDYLAFRSKGFRLITQGRPIVLVAEGRPLQDVLSRCHLDTDDIITAAREKHGLERLQQIKWALLETSGSISVVPYDPKPLTAGASPGPV